MDAENACSEAIKIQDEPRLYCDRAEAYMAEDMFDEVSLKTKTAVAGFLFWSTPNPGFKETKNMGSDNF